MRIVLDTNVLVSALLTRSGNPDYVVGLVRNGTVGLVVDVRILLEYEEVTARPEFRWLRADRLDVLEELAAVAEQIPVPSTLALALADPDDLMFVEVAVAGAVDAIITGNVKHFRPRRGKMPVAVLTPRQFVDRLRR
jgi:putative PIN family toxin of toxin-antitoxin system